MMNFSTIPQWMFKTKEPVNYSWNPNSANWGYGGGTELRDTTMKELTDYYVRLISWYTKGGFTDELGKYHRSGYHYNIQYWEVLNEPDGEHNMSPMTYTKIYDAMTIAIRCVLPEVKFVGLAIASEKPEWFEYFLNPANHKPNVSLDMISYHYYAGANRQQKFEDYQYTCFDKAESFVNTVTFIENIRKRLSPQTQTDINELGTFLSDDMRNKPIPTNYWNLSASIYTYFFIELSKIGINVIGESQLVGFPTQFPDVSMINYQNNKPNARYWVLKLIKDNIQSGNKLIYTKINGDLSQDIVSQAFISENKRIVLLLNKRDKINNIKIPINFKDAKIYTIDSASGDQEAIGSQINGDSIEMGPFAVKLVVLK